jgi:hypothetical protein
VGEREGYGKEFVEKLSIVLNYEEVPDSIRRKESGGDARNVYAVLPISACMLAEMPE